MAANRNSGFNQIILLIGMVGMISVIAVIPVIPKARSLVTRALYVYYNAAPSWSIVNLFDNYAENFDEHLTKTLEYNTTADLTEFIHANTIQPNPILKVLDLGCGTGLFGQALTKQFKIDNLVGIDLSSKMLEKSKTKAVYNELHKADILEYLQKHPDNYDVIAATDVFVYVGDLKPIMHQVYQQLKPDGYFAFSIESLPIGTFKLMPSGRFQHSLSYIEAVAADTGFKDVRSRAISLRKEYGVMLQGYLILMQK